MTLREVSLEFERRLDREVEVEFGEHGEPEPDPEFTDDEMEEHMYD